MCLRVTCESCEKPTYVGCGRHIEAVLGDVAPEARCHCKETNLEQKQPPGGRGAWLSALFGKSGARRP